ncbi:MAG: hypothetical protein PWR25_680 [Euryarchaeota archaeon]|nr:hypothetical protein [Euryarchaeota archaeon]
MNWRHFQSAPANKRLIQAENKVDAQPGVDT